MTEFRSAGKDIFVSSSPLLLLPPLPFLPPSFFSYVSVGNAHVYLWECSLSSMEARHPVLVLSTLSFETVLSLDLELAQRLVSATSFPSPLHWRGRHAQLLM